MNSDLDGTITKAMAWKMHGMKLVWKNIYLSILKAKVIVAFLGNVSITLMSKTDGKDPKRRANYWMRTRKGYVPFGLIGDSVWPIPCRSINVFGGLTCLVFFGILVRPGTDLRQDFSDKKCFFFFNYLFVILCNLFLRYMLLFHYMLILFPLSGVSYCTIYLFIILMYTLVKLNALLFLYVSITSVASASYFILCVILFDLG